MTRSYLRTGLALVVVFALGAVTGASVMHATTERRLRAMLLGDPAAMRSRVMLHALDHRLSLTPRQHDTAARLLDAQADRYRAALERSRPEIRALRREFTTALEPALDAEQRALLEVFSRDAERFR